MRRASQAAPCAGAGEETPTLEWGYTAHIARAARTSDSTGSAVLAQCPTGSRIQAPSRGRRCECQAGPGCQCPHFAFAFCRVMTVPVTSGPVGMKLTGVRELAELHPSRRRGHATAGKPEAPTVTGRGGEVAG